MFQTTLTGNLGKDAEVRTLDSGVKAISFSIAHTEKWQKDGETKEKTTWVNCTIWRGKDASAKIADYLKKGQKVLVQGQVSARPWKTNEGEARAELELRVDVVELLGKNDSSGSASNSGSAPSSNTSSNASFTAQGDDDDLPF